MQVKAIRRMALDAVPPVGVVALASVAAAPLFHAGIPSTDDGMNHLVKFAGFSQSLSHGDLYPRLVQSLNLGFGSPVFTYYAPLSYYLAQGFHLLRAHFNASVRLVFVAAILLGALGMYYAGCEWGGRPAGFVAGVAQGALPYLLHNVYLRGAMPEALAMGIEPWTLFAYSRYVRTDHSRWLVLAAATTAAISFTHNISTLIFLPFLVLWGVVVVMHEPRGSPALKPFRWAALQRLLAASALGFGAAEVYWLPALLERGAVHVERTLATGSVADHFSRALLPWSPSFFYQYAHETPATPLRPGLAQVTFAIGGAAVFVLHAWQRRSRRALWLLLCVPAAILVLFMQHQASTFIWERVPLAPFVQFPYRLYAIFGLITSLFAGLLTLAVRQPAARWTVAVVAALLSLVVGVRQLHPIYGYGVPPDLDPRGLFLTETAAGNLGGTANGEYLPSAVGLSPEELVASVTRPRTGPQGTVAPNTAATVNQVTDTSQAINVHASGPTSLSLRRFAMPGWTVVANGRDLDVHPTGPLGLLTVDVPAGDQLVELTQAQTPTENVALVTSLACVAIFGTWMFSRGSTWTWLNEEARGYVFISMLVVAAAVALLAPRPSLELTLMPTTPVDVAPGYQLAGIQVDRSAVASRGTVQVILHLLCRQPGTDLLFELRAEDGQGHVYAQSKARPWNGPTSAWQAGEVGEARLDLTVPPNVPEQGYELTVTVFDAAHPDHDFTTVTLAQANLPALPRHPYHELDVDAGGSLLFRGYRVDGEERDDTVAMPADRRLGVTFDVQSLRPIYQNLKLFVHLVGPDGRVWPQQDEMVGGVGRQTGSWQSGETARQTVVVGLPPDAPPGEYAFELGVYDPATGQRLPVLGDDGKPSGDAARFGKIIVAR